MKDNYGAKIDDHSKNETFSLSVTNNSAIYSPKVAGLKPKYFHIMLQNKSKNSSERSRTSMYF